MLLISLSGYLSRRSALLLLHGSHSQPVLLLLPLGCWHGFSCSYAYASTVYCHQQLHLGPRWILSAALPLHWHLFISWNKLSSRTLSAEVPLTELPLYSSSIWPGYSHPTDLPSKHFQATLPKGALSASKCSVSCQSINFLQSIHHNVNFIMCLLAYLYSSPSPLNWSGSSMKTWAFFFF